MAGSARTNEWLRLPGLFRRWEFEQVIEPGEDFYFEPAGTTSDGSLLFAIYRREHQRQEENNDE